MKFQVLASRGQGGYRQYRIPALSVTKSGRLIAIYDGRPDFDDLPAPIDLLIKTSDDNGNTWSEQKVFRSHESISGFGDASIIVDSTFGQYGRLIVLYQYTVNAGFFESEPGSDITNPNIAHIGRSISDDDGRTWKHDLITQQLKADDVEGIFATSGSGSQIKNGEFTGRLLQTFVIRKKGEIFSAIGFSDDHGETWALGASIPGGNESAVESLSDGSILLHSRSTPFRLSGTSRDGGISIDSIFPHPELPDPSDNGSLCRLSDDSIICTHNCDHDLRRNTVVRLSNDGGKSWTKAAQIEAGSSAYSTACELIDQSIGVLFERDSYNEIVFCKLTRDDFQPIEDLSNNLIDANGLDFMVVPRCIIPGRRGKSSDLKIESRAKVPSVDMAKFNPAERKEVGPAGGSTSGNYLLTWDEYDYLLGPVSSGLHLGDEVRVSGRLTNLSSSVLENLEIRHDKSGFSLQRSTLNPGDKEVFLDVRQDVTAEDIVRGIIQISCKYRAMLKDVELSEKRFIQGESIISISIETGLEIKTTHHSEAL